MDFRRTEVGRLLRVTFISTFLGCALSSMTQSGFRPFAFDHCRLAEFEAAENFSLLAIGMPILLNDATS